MLEIKKTQNPKTNTDNNPKKKSSANNKSEISGGNEPAKDSKAEEAQKAIEAEDTKNNEMIEAGFARMEDALARMEALKKEPQKPQNKATEEKTSIIGGIWASIKKVMKGIWTALTGSPKTNHQEPREELSSIRPGKNTQPPQKVIKQGQYITTGTKGLSRASEAKTANLQAITGNRKQPTSDSKKEL